MLGISVDQLAFGIKGFLLSCYIDPEHWVDMAKKGKLVSEVVDTLTNVKLH